MPGAVVCGFAGEEQILRERLIVREQPAHDVPERDHARAGQRCDVDHRLRFEALGIGQCIAQDQPSLGVGVEDFHGLSRHAGNDVAGLGGAAARHVLGGGNDADDVNRQPHFGGRLQGAEHARGTAHVEFHLVHFGAGLERNAAGIEGDAFADQCDRLAVLRAGAVFERDQFRWLRTAARHRQQRAHAEFFHVVALQHLHFHAVALGEFACLLREVGRGAEVGRQIPEILREQHAVRDGEALFQARLGAPPRRFVAHAEGELAQRGLLLIAPAFHAVKAVARFARHRDRLRDAPRDVALHIPDLGEMQRSLRGAGRVQRPDRRCHRLAVLLVAELAVAAETHQQHALARNVRHVMQQERAAELAIHVAAREDGGQMSARCAIERGTRGAELARLEHADHAATGADALRTPAFYAKFHRILPKSDWCQKSLIIFAIASKIKARRSEDFPSIVGA